jgi:hypothetical protein
LSRMARIFGEFEEKEEDRAEARRGEEDLPVDRTIAESLGRGWLTVASNLSPHYSPRTYPPQSPRLRGSA